MSLRQPIGGGDDRPLPPEGNHPARVYSVVGLGTQPNEKYGPKPKLRITFALAEEKRDFGKGIEEAFLVSREMSIARGKKATMPPIIEGIIGRRITEKEYANPEPMLMDLIGKACLLNLSHSPGKDGERVYANIETVTPCPTRMLKDIPPMQDRGVYYTVEMGPNCPEFESLPDFLKAKVSRCLEWTNGGGDEQLELNFG